MISDRLKLLEAEVDAVEAWAQQHMVLWQAIIDDPEDDHTPPRPPAGAPGCHWTLRCQHGDCALAAAGSSGLVLHSISILRLTSSRAVREPKNATHGWRLGGRRRGRATSCSLASGTLLEREEKECRKHFCSRKVVYRYTLVYL